MIPLIDADILVYEIGSCGEYDDDEGVHQTREFDFVSGLLDTKIREICEEAWADEPPLLFLTNSESTTALYNRMYGFTGEKLEYRPNFREAVATVRPYKGNRAGKKKPYHTQNIIAYMLAQYNVKIANGMEADDLLGIYQRQGREAGKETIIITRDKDLRINPGWHYGWACGKQPAFGPEEIPDDLVGIHILKKSGKWQIVGVGYTFFLSQILTGDSTDDYPGLPGCGPVATYNLLTEVHTKEERLCVIATAYYKKYGDDWKERMTEQAQLAWMVNTMIDGDPVMWEMPDGVQPEEV